MNRTGMRDWPFRKPNQCSAARSTGKTCDQNFMNESFHCRIRMSGALVLINFQAESRSPCKLIAPARELLATEFGGRLAIAKVNIYENPGASTGSGFAASRTEKMGRNNKLAPSGGDRNNIGCGKRRNDPCDPSASLSKPAAGT